MSKERELLLWLQGYLYDKSDLGNREMIMLKDKIEAFLDKDDNKEPNPKITYWGGSPACNNPDTVRPRDTQPWELDPNEVTCSNNTDPFVQAHDGNTERELFVADAVIETLEKEVKELKFKLKMYTREIEQLEELSESDTKEIQRLQHILYEKDIDF